MVKNLATPPPFRYEWMKPELEEMARAGGGRHLIYRREVSTGWTLVTVEASNTLKRVTGAPGELAVRPGDNAHISTASKINRY